MISAWEVYLFMQSSNIATGILLLSIGLLVGALAHAIVIETNYTESKKDYSVPKRNIKISVAIFLFALLIPSRETIAAMYIVPKLTSKEFIEPVTKEAKELYDVFKKSLVDKK